MQLIHMTDSDLNQLSPHLFWDVEQVSWDTHSAFLVQRILEYGSLEDFRLLRLKIGLDGIVEIAKQLRSLEHKTLNFISVIANCPLNEFRCYSSIPSPMSSIDF
jgi:hypothetical protein